MTNGKDSLWLDRALGPDGAQTLADRIADAGAKDSAIAALAALPLFRSAVAEAVKSCLHIDLLALFAEGWRTAQEIRAAKDGDGATILKLGAHDVSRDIKPVLRIAEMRKPLDVSITFTGTFEGIELAIANGALTSVGSGTCDLTVTFELAGQELQDPITVAQWKLPGEYRFDPPLPIP